MIGPINIEVFFGLRAFVSRQPYDGDWTQLSVCDTADATGPVNSVLTGWQTKPISVTLTGWQTKSLGVKMAETTLIKGGLVHAVVRNCHYPTRASTKVYRLDGILGVSRKYGYFNGGQPFSVELEFSVERLYVAKSLKSLPVLSQDRIAELAINEGMSPIELLAMLSSVKR